MRASYLIYISLPLAFTFSHLLRLASRDSAGRSIGSRFIKRGPPGPNWNGHPMREWTDKDVMYEEVDFSNTIDDTTSKYNDKSGIKYAAKSNEEEDLRDESGSQIENLGGSNKEGHFLRS